MNCSAYISKPLAFMAVASAFAFHVVAGIAEPLHGDYVGKSTTEIANNLVMQGYKFREFNWDDSNLLEAEVVKDGKQYEIFADPWTGRIVKIIEGDETNEIPLFKCSERSKFIGYLADTFAEKPVAIGMASNGSIIELLKSIDGDSWTIIMTTPNGISCRISAGEKWQPLVNNVTLDQ